MSESKDREDGGRACAVASRSSTSRAAPASPNPPFPSFSPAAPSSPSRRASASTARCSALGYVYHRGAASLRAASSDFVGMVISDLTNPFFAELAVGIEDALYKLGFTPILANTNENPERQAQVLRSLREHNVAGIIMSPARGADAWTLAQQWPPSIPAVITMRRMIGSPLPYVGPDNRKGARDAVEHLLRLGHRRIGFLGGDASMTTQQERVERLARRAQRLRASPPTIRSSSRSAPTRAGGREAIERALAAAAAADRGRLLQRHRRDGRDARAQRARHRPRPRHRRRRLRRHRRGRTQRAAADHRQRRHARDGRALRGEPARPHSPRGPGRRSPSRARRGWSCAKAAAPGGRDRKAS